MEKAIFAAGCFWGVEADFRAVHGVNNAISGYTGGTTKNPTYEQVCAGKTGHAEAVQVTYDPALVSYEDLLNTFWEMHDPTTMNRQGPDVGTQYRSAIFYADEAERAQAEKSKAEAAVKFPRPIATEITAATAFYPAEDYHQRYVERRGH